MGQKIRPSGLRLGIIRDWDSRWYADKEYREFLLEDHKIRQYILNRFRQASISGIQIERRVGDAVRITLHSGKPGIIIGRGGAGVELLKGELEKLLSEVRQVERAYEEEREAYYRKEGKPYKKKKSFLEIFDIFD